MLAADQEPGFLEGFADRGEGEGAGGIGAGAAAHLYQQAAHGFRREVAGGPDPAVGGIDLSPLILILLLGFLRQWIPELLLG